MYFSGSFPHTRLRRLRNHPWMRDMVQETRLHVSDLILPVFIRTPESPAEIQSMPGVRRWALAELPQIVEQILEAGIPAIDLFPLIPPELKTPEGNEGWNPDNLMCQAIQAIKEMAPQLGVIADVALDPYTLHGHDGVWNGTNVDNDLTVGHLCRQAVVQAAAGADILAPSDMMDGRVREIRKALDDAGYQDRAIMSYAAKFASSFYGPFREAVGAARLPANAGNPGDKKSYHMNPANAEEALREVALDLDEGADMILIKPGLPCLDIIHRVRTHFQVPVFGYQVSGEYCMIKAAGAKGWLNEQAVMAESLLAIKRAGAVGIFTYAALEAAQWLRNRG